MAENCHLENRQDLIFFWWGWSDLDKFCRLVQNDMFIVMIWSKLKAEVKFLYDVSSHIAGCYHLANLMACHPRAMCHIAGCCHLVNLLWCFQSHMPHCRVLPAGIFNDMSSQSDVSHFNMLPLGEFTVMTPEPHATLQGAATWRIHCHDSSATFHIAGCKNSICHIDNRFLPYFIFVLFS